MLLLENENKKHVLFIKMALNNLLRPHLFGPLLNKADVATLWMGSYKIQDASKYLDRYPKPQRWPRYNELVQEPQTNPLEERRPATYYHFRENIKSSPKKMWHVAKFMRGLNVDEAIKQLKFMNLKTAQIAADVLEEAQAKAVRDHNFEFKSKMWVDDVRIAKGLVIKGVRRHARMRYGQINYFYVHMCIKLTEGEPPVHFYRPKQNGNDLLRKYYKDLRSREIKHGLS